MPSPASQGGFDRFRHLFSDKKNQGLSGRLRERLMVRRWRERGVWILSAFTFMYLIVEFSFSAWLLEKMAQDRITGLGWLETQGRALSGFAVALLFWPLVFARTRTWVSTFLWLSLGSVLIMILVSLGERMLIDRLVEQSSAQDRAAAVTGSLLRKGLASGAINGDMLDGLWAEPTANSVAGKAFVGVVAYMAAGSAPALRQTQALAQDVVRGVVEQEMGGLDGEYQRFLDSQYRINLSHGQYQYWLKWYAEDMQKVPARANRLWEHYLDRLAIKNRDWGRARIGRSRGGELVPGFVAPSVRAEVRKLGLDVKDSWSTGDKATFVRLAEEKERKARRAGLEQQLDGLPVNLSLAAFAAHPKTQKKWREGLEYPDNIGSLPLAEITREQFEQRFYHRALAGRTHDGLRNYTHQVGDYRDGGSQADEGKEAYEAMIAPVFALILSLLGALVHIAKSALLGVQLKSGWRFRSPVLKTGAIVAVVLLALALGRTFISTSLTSHPTYQAWTGTASEQSSGTLMLDTMIRMQTLAYPVFKVPLSMMGYVAATAKDWKRQAPAVQ